ncbi:ABC transporter permease subunit [Vibrio gangliei]|uniref:ABC transporter permease subunit n=1 Tax=Vibrio gangliei TaxID=2077090 RepID=UPI001FE5ACE0|nr:ABC transporter permease subunit [Vibrio gangliei]
MNPSSVNPVGSTAKVEKPAQSLCKTWQLDKKIGRKLVIGVPFFWLLIFFLLPFVIVLKISFSMADVAIPPYTELVSWADDQITILLNMANYMLLGEDDLYLAAYLSSLKMAFISTLACLLIGYPMAYAIARAKKETQTILLLLIMMPTWTAILIRVYAWMGILSNNGLLNGFLLQMGVIDSPLHILNTDLAVYIGIVYSYLPFMVLPLYANLSKHDQSLLEAASDLGCRNVSTFWQITVPLSKGGIIAGCMLVFIPVVGEFVIPELLGGPDTLMIGKVLWQEFFNNRDWPVAAALAVVMLAILMIPIIFFNRTQAKELQGK